MSCAQIKSEFVPLDLVPCQIWLGLVLIKSICQCMMIENGGFAVRPLSQATNPALVDNVRLR